MMLPNKVTSLLSLKLRGNDNVNDKTSVRLHDFYLVVFGFFLYIII